MEQFDFNTITDRHNTNSIKTDLAVLRGKPEDVLPLWVADMDFPTAPCILEALHKKVDHGIFGYSCTDQNYFESVKNWMKTEHNFEIDRKWIVTTPGVVFAIACAIKAFTKENEAVIIQTPVYYPFKNMIDLNNRKCVTCSLIEKNGKSWLTALENHLQENLDFLRNWLKTNLPKVRLIEPEGTFLLWLDFSAYNFSDKELDEIIVHKAKVWLDRGTMFGSEGNNFQRINIATPQPLLQEALERIKNALE